MHPCVCVCVCVCVCACADLIMGNAFGFLISHSTSWKCVNGDGTANTQKYSVYTHAHRHGHTHTCARKRAHTHTHAHTHHSLFKNKTHSAEDQTSWCRKVTKMSYSHGSPNIMEYTHTHTHTHGEYVLWFCFACCRLLCYKNSTRFYCLTWNW